MAVGDVPVEVLALVRLRDGEGCVECRRLGLTPPPSEPLELDHKQPVSQGGDYHWTNLRWLCRSHNRGRRDRRLSGARPAWARRQDAAHATGAFGGAHE